MSHILVVEDDEILSKLFEEVLRAEGYFVVVAKTTAIARKEIAAHLPDLMIVDMALPGEDGLSLIREIKSDARKNHIPIICTTAYTGNALRENGVSAGADYYLPKPISPQVLRQAVKEGLERVSE